MPRAGTTLLLLAVVAVSYAPFYVPALFFDDWNHVVERMVSQSATWLDLGNRRPLLFAPYLLAHRLFGLNVDVYFASQLVLLGTSGFLLYAIVRRLWLGSSYAIICVLLFLLYPTDYSRLWLSLSHARWALILTLSFGLLLFEYGRQPRWWRWMLALVCLVLSLGLYEAQLGIVCVWSLFLAWRVSDKGIGVRLRLLTPIAVAVVFAVWRSFGYQAVGIEDSYLSLVSPDLVTWLGRLILGYKISLLWGWTTTIHFFVPALSGNRSAGLFLVFAIFVLCFVVRLALRGRNHDGIEAASQRDRTRSEDGRRIVMSGLFGFVLIGAGYVPVIAAFEPNLSGVGSRFNLFATIGGAVFSASCLMGLARMVGRSRSEVDTLFITSALPLLVLGMVTQWAVQHDGRQAWQEQKSIWQQLFEVAPNFRDGTTVLFVLPGFADRQGYQNWRRPPLAASWEVRSALRVLYDNPTLKGEVVFPNIDLEIEPRLSLQGITSYESGHTTPFSEIVAVQYEGESGRLRSLKALSADWVEGAKLPVQLDWQRVGPHPNRHVPLRRLVQ